MACSCSKGKGRQYEVVADGGTGKVLYGPSPSEATCKAVAKRYPNSIVREKPKVTATAVKTTK